MFGASLYNRCWHEKFLLNWLKRDQRQRVLFLSISNTDAMTGCQVTSFVSNLLNKRHLLSAAFAYMKTSQFGLQLLKGVSYATFQFIEVIILWTPQRRAFSWNSFNYQFYLYTKLVSVKQGKLATSAQIQATIHQVPAAFSNLMRKVSYQTP